MGISKRLMMARDDLAYANWVLECTDDEYEAYEGLPRTEDDLEYYARSVAALKKEIEGLEALAIKFGLTTAPVSENETDKGLN